MHPFSTCICFVLSYNFRTFFILSTNPCSCIDLDLRFCIHPHHCLLVPCSTFNPCPCINPLALLINPHACIDPGDTACHRTFAEYNDIPCPVDDAIKARYITVMAAPLLSPSTLSSFLFHFAALFSSSLLSSPPCNLSLLPGSLPVLPLRFLFSAFNSSLPSHSPPFSLCFPTHLLGLTSPYPSPSIHICRLRGAGVDENLAHHVAHLFTRDPLVIFDGKVELDDQTTTEHFENIQSTNWQTCRWKPPPPRTSPDDPHIGWRTGACVN